MLYQKHSHKNNRRRKKQLGSRIRFQHDSAEDVYIDNVFIISVRGSGFFAVYVYSENTAAADRAVLYYGKCDYPTNIPDTQMSTRLGYYLLSIT